MSYAAGMALGLSIGQKVFELFNDGVAKSKSKVCDVVVCMHLVHSLPGRRRYVIAGLKNNIGLAAILENYLSQLIYVKKISANPITGSLLLEYNCEEETVDDLVKYLSDRVFGTVDCISRMGNKELAGLGNQLYDFFVYWNNYLKEKTTNAIDFRSLTAFMFIVAGLRKLVMRRQMPAAPQLLWWAFSLLRR